MSVEGLLDVRRLASWLSRLTSRVSIRFPADKIARIARSSAVGPAKRLQSCDQLGSMRGP
jgi:hypothetical protein